MAVGVLAPALGAAAWPRLLVAAVCVGGTFMVATMAGLQEARRLAGAAAPRLMAAMTAAFALGQLAGPVVVAAGDGVGRRRHRRAEPWLGAAVPARRPRCSMRGARGRPSATLRPRQGHPP